MLRIGILGAARIAAEFVAGLKASSRVQVVAIASRDAKRAAEFAAQHGVGKTYGSYEELLAQPDIDAIYNPLPNGLHKEWTLAAARAGKHILCEKPLACDEADGRAMFAAADAAGVKLLEAYPYLYQPLTLDLVRLVTTGPIGAPRLVQGAFSFMLTRTEDVRLDPALGGGAMLDLGCYVVSLARLVFGSRPLRAVASAEWTERGVDRTFSATVDFPDGGLAQVSCSFARSLHRRALIAGTEGVIETNFPNHTDVPIPPLLALRRGRGAEENLPVPPMNGFLLEAEAFADLVEGRPGRHDQRALSLDTLAALDAIRASARAEQPVIIARNSV